MSPQVTAMLADLGVPGPVRIMYRTSHDGAVRNEAVTLTDLASRAERIDATTNLWVSTSTFDPLSPTHGADDVVTLHALSVDVDDKNPAGREDSWRIVRALAERVGAQPRVVVDSGHGLQPHWRIDASPPDHKALWLAWKALVLDTAAALGLALDRGAFGPERVWRAPGTMNSKAGQESVAASILAGSTGPALAVAHVMALAAPLLVVPVRADVPVLAPATSAYGAKALSGIVQDVMDTAQGGRNDALNRAAFKAGQLVGGGSLDGEATRSALMQAGLAVGLDDGEVAATVTSGLAGGVKSPRGVRSAVTVEQMPPDPLPESEEIVKKQIEIRSEAGAKDWLTENLGLGGLSGVFLRDGNLISTVRIDLNGYVSSPADEKDALRPVRTINHEQLWSLLGYKYDFYKTVQTEDGGRKRSAKMFPKIAAQSVALTAELAPNVRKVSSVVFTPILRADGTILDQPGYDESSQVLYLPAKDHDVDPIPDVPTDSDVRSAKFLIDTMLKDFSFVSDDDRANYIGMMMTPLLRLMCPPPWKFSLIEAHQPGSGKTFLARVLLTLHGGTFKVDVPKDDIELSKVITSILDVSTGSVVLFDNTSGTIKSPKLAGLFTSDTWEDRRLGSNTVVSATNDKMWAATGNNLRVGGDIARRTLRCRIDPGVPEPEKRTGFAIPDFEGWVVQRREALLRALLVLARRWAADGAVRAPASGSDSYARWVATVRGILAGAGIPGVFDADSTAAVIDDEDATEAGAFLEAVREEFGERGWIVREVLDKVNDSGISIEGPITTPIPYEALPDAVTLRRRGSDPLSKSAKSLGKWLKDNEGRFVGNLSVRSVKKDREGTWWKVVSQ